MDRRSPSVIAVVLLIAGLVVGASPAPATAAGGEATTPRYSGLGDRLEAGLYRTCVINDVGAVACWGVNGSGQLGYGNTSTIGDNETPSQNVVNGGFVALPGGHSATAVMTSNSHTCAILDNGTVSCWGYGNSGRLGYGNLNDIGDNETPADNPVNGGIVPLPGGHTATAIVGGGDHTCALLDDGTVTCWGLGTSGQLGYGNTNNIGDNETPAQNPVNGGIVPLPGGHTAVAITAGYEFTCAILDNGHVACWGDNVTGQLGYGNTNDIGDNETPALNPVGDGTVDLPGIHTAVAITAGVYHVCVILDHGKVLCWGDGLSGQLGYGNTTDIGDNESPSGSATIALPADRNALAITAGEFHNCAILDNQTVTCWGASSSGSLGYGNVNQIGDNETPAANPVNGGIVPLPGGRTAVAITAGDIHTCAILDNGGVTCWGSGDGGGMGYGNTNPIGDNETPAANPVTGGIVSLSGAHTAAAISGGGNHTCGLLDNGAITCWGYAADGALGYGNINLIGDNETPGTNPVGGGIISLPGNRTATSVVSGGYHTCAILDNSSVTCWGYAFSGELGYGNTNNIGENETPAANPVNGGIVSLPGARTAVAITAGSWHTCALLDNGSVTCWGDSGGVLGYGNTNKIGDNETPATNPVNGGIVPLPGGRSAIAIDSGFFHTCAILDDGSVTCWGDNAAGQLGYGNVNFIGDNETPATNPVNGGIVPLPVGRTAISVTTGGLHTCVLLDNGTVTCWGANNNGQLGVGNTVTIGDNEAVNGALVALPGGHTATSISAANQHTCALLDDATVTCWGDGSVGRLGYGNINNIGDNETPATNPVNGGIIATPGGRTVTSISGAYAQTCAVLNNRSTTCWGYGTGGMLGYGNTSTIGDDDTPAGAGVLRLPQSLSPIDYRAVQPARLLDTRGSGTTVDGLFQKGGQRAAGSTLSLAVAGRGGIPADATSITLSVAAVAPASGGFLTIWPCDETQPNASSLNFATGVTTANTVITGVTGGVCIFTSKATHLITDVVGFTPRSTSLTTITPTRYVDTRASGLTFDTDNQATGIRSAGSTYTIDIGGRGGLTVPVPGSTTTAILNVAAVGPAGNGFLTIHPCGIATPNASNLNYTTGTNTANLVITRLAADGTVCVYTSQATHLIIDVVGYYSTVAAPVPAMMRTVNPGRLVDTRVSGATTDNRYEKTGALVANATNSYQITDRPPLGSANVAVLNVTVVGPAAGGFLTIWPCDQSKPNASSLNYVGGVNRAVQVVTKLSPSGTVCVSASTVTHLIIDANGTTM